MVKEENMTGNTENLPPSLDFFLNWIGIADENQNIINTSTDSKGLPDDYMDSSHGWLPSYPGQEPPF